MQNKISVREASQNEIVDWDALVSRFENHRLPHKASWLRSLAETVKGKVLFLVCEKDGEIVGCLPGLVVNVGPLRIFGSPLPGWQTVSMGPVFDQNRTSASEIMRPVISWLETKHGIHHIEIMTADCGKSEMENLGFTGTPEPIYRVPLFPDDPDRAKRAMKHSARTYINRAERFGLQTEFRNDEEFVDEIYDQMVEVYERGGNVVPYGKERVLTLFRHMKDSGNLLAIAVNLPDGKTCIATGLFFIDNKELIMWSWTCRTEYRYHSPTELLTWTIMQRAMEMGCTTFDLSGGSRFKKKFGARLEDDKIRWIRSRYAFLGVARSVAQSCFKFQQRARGQIAQKFRPAEKIPSQAGAFAMENNMNKPIACVMGDIDMLRPLGLAEIPCAVMAKRGAMPRFSRYNRQTLEWGDAWQEPQKVLELLMDFGRSQTERPVLFYEHDAYLLLISRNRERLGEYFRFLLPDAELVEDIVDKLRFRDLAERVGLPVPRTQLLYSDSAWSDVDLKFPFIVKPLLRSQPLWAPVAGMSKAIRIDNEAGLEKFRTQNAKAEIDLLAQELVDGPESSIESYQIYADRNGKVAGEFTGRKIRTHPKTFGHSCSLEIADLPDTRELGRKLARKLKLRGVAEFEFKRAPDGELFLLEVNSRFNLWHHLGAAAGVNLPAIVYADLTERPRPETKPARSGTRWLRPWQDFLSSRADGVPLTSWMQWAMTCEVKRGLSLDDPVAPLAGAAWRTGMNLMNLVRPPRAVGRENFAALKSVKEE